MKIGDRVGAILGKDGDSVKVFGYGVYDGEHIPPKEAGGFNFGIPNHRIKLDNGKHVYGCESWWGPEEEIIERLKGKKVIIIDIDEERRKESDAKLVEEEKG